MKGILKRLQCLAAAATVIGLGLTACAPASAPGASTPSGDTSSDLIEVTISFWDIQNSFPEGEPDAIAKMVQDRFKIKLVPVNVGWGDADEKYNTWAASGQLPDVIGAVSLVVSPRFNQWINDGVVRPLPDDLSAYPEISKLMDQPEVKAFTVAGKNYFLPRQTYTDAAYWAMDRGLLARKDWMEKVGITDPKTEEDYINLTVAFAKNDPDGNGVDDTAGYTPADPVFIYSQGWPGFGYTDNRWVLDTDGKYRIALAGEKAFNLFKFIKRMYQAGGLDPDFATLDTNQAIEKFATGKTGILGMQVSPTHLNTIMKIWAKAQPDKKFTDHIIFLHGPTVDGSYYRFVEMAYWSETYFSSKVDDAKMKRILEMFNWLYSEEGRNTMMYGIEGVDWVKQGDQIKLLTPIDQATGLHKSAAEIYPFTSAMNSLALWGPDVMQYNDPLIDEKVRAMCEEERDYRIANWKAQKLDWAVFAIDVPEKQEMAAVKFSDDWVKFILDTSGKSDEQLYEEMKQNWDANGYAAAVEAITAKAKELGIK
ncbi:MAG: extracellular solute-binding protein [Anaerolineae bacterium]|nr:extracellular solute-binding protein [Candidatus Roseilinea sp.]MDW8450615.1 extracellular solute-binding protein [Anaerolineae bacterium]